ncbi:MAG: C-GCAxxG-C-C family protein [Sterolibacterium sp.]|jgi:C_GCAxxG_C_C family probable redox protein
MEQESRTLLAQEAYEKAAKYELDYGCCPQCVLATIQETLGMIDDQTIKASHGLSGGGGLLGDGICGALSGALLALGAKYGRDRDKLGAGRYMNNFKKAREFTERFREEFGGVTCKELQVKFTGRTYDMWRPEEYQAFDSNRGNQCAHATGTVTRWLVEVL